jgi:hypothetical protein
MPPLTVGEIEYSKRLERAARIYSDAVKKQIKLEAMKAANQERLDRGESLAYGEEAFLKLLEE